ncbi:NAD(+) synthase [Burkholderia glumae]|uniref:Glutamine-dependent NAD(+) synthetase n=2 Tax=Burkholderia glumae TaxID=337 RepID=A0AAP9XWG7_BURGL|nr:NAD(+) synthase [Burkholderia glumae]ACR31667.1 NAD+ synthase [Burkholderia glumae BGR1]AJY62827.1 NAD+ synthetase [Burkholderia glumae LMG 2196 = ATCC 33617]MCM2485166.1 NAD(+) synthase [Burkholderia glumae]MCM2510861.1 NAD(+) synthase [Burkholderia glumae]MCM2540688.1 NAD(+) synthase [Burkholderia glumae]
MNDFFSMYRHGFLRVAVAIPPVVVADPAANLQATLRLARDAAGRGALVTILPELGLSAYTNDELFFQRALLDGVKRAIGKLRAASAELPGLIVAGAPLEWSGRLYNAAVVLHRGRILGVVPKSYLPNYGEFYEKRYFASGLGVTGGTLRLDGAEVPFGTDLLFRADDYPELVLGVEICEDLWAPVPPSTYAAHAGATVIANLSASNITVGKSEYRRLHVRSHSARCQAAYLYSAAGCGESTTDLAWDGHALVCESGEILAETERFADTAQLLVADLDLQRIMQERLRVQTFDDCARALGGSAFRNVGFALAPPRGPSGPLQRRLDRFPFVPADVAMLDANCEETFMIQSHGLAKRLRATGLEQVVIGVSGGLDSTYALLVCALTMDRLGLDRRNILAYTLPGYATSRHTLDNAWALMHVLGVSAREIDIKPVSDRTLADIGHPAAQGEARYDVTYENVQAGARSAYLFRLANANRAIVIGTGDLSELALGWCTYGVGDQMSHYNVNGSVPKTLIQQMVRWLADRQRFGADAAGILRRIVETEISPELVPGNASQSTEQAIGPYALQDFNLYHVTRYGFGPAKIAFLAWHAWHDAEAGDWPPLMDSRPAYDLAAIKRWLVVFVKRFFEGSQFKRSALPNGPKVAAGSSLSPRGDWRAPSDSVAQAWLDELTRAVSDQPAGDEDRRERALLAGRPLDGEPADGNAR